MISKCLTFYLNIMGYVLLMGGWAVDLIISWYVTDSIQDLTNCLTGWSWLQTKPIIFKTLLKLSLTSFKCIYHTEKNTLCQCYQNVVIRTSAMKCLLKRISVNYTCLLLLVSVSITWGKLFYHIRYRYIHMHLLNPVSYTK